MRGEDQEIATSENSRSRPVRSSPPGTRPAFGRPTMRTHSSARFTARLCHVSVICAPSGSVRQAEKSRVRRQGESEGLMCDDRIIALPKESQPRIHAGTTLVDTTCSVSSRLTPRSARPHYLQLIRPVHISSEGPEEFSSRMGRAACEGEGQGVEHPVIQRAAATEVGRMTRSFAS